MEGDRAALDLVLAAVATHRAALDEGSVDCRVTAPGQRGPLSDEEAEFSLRWRDGHGFSQFRSVMFLLGGGSREIRGREWSGGTRILRTPDETFSFEPRQSTLWHSKFPPDSERIALVAHSRFWPRWDWFATQSFGYEDESARWDVAFDPTRLDANPATVAIRAEADGDEITLSSPFRSGNVRTAVASREAGWNVVRYDSNLVSEEYVGVRGTFEWERNPDGVYWVRRMTTQRFSVGSEGPVVTREFSNFTTSVPADADFTRTALEIPADARVQLSEYTANGVNTRTVGRRPEPGVSGRRLNELGLLLRESSFLAGEGD